MVMSSGLPSNSPSIQLPSAQDPEPQTKSGKWHVGFAAWDVHVAYRNISLKPPVDMKDIETLRAVGGVPSLFCKSAAVLVKNLSPHSVCTVLRLLSVMSWSTAYEKTALYAASNLMEVRKCDLCGLRDLPVECIRSIAQADVMVCCIVSQAENGITNQPLVDLSAGR